MGNEVRRYVSKPIEIEASKYESDDLRPMVQAWGFDFTRALIYQAGSHLILSTPEGEMRIPIGSYIIKGTQGEFYGCRADIFETKYRSVKQRPEEKPKDHPDLYD